MKNFVKIILYAYPLLKTVEKDYEEHIANKALLSYDGRWTAEQTAEYLAKEIIEMRRLEWLKGKVKRVLDKLTEEERALVEIKYFGKRKKWQFLFNKENPSAGKWTERSYFRRQQRLGEKLSALFIAEGIDEKRFVDELSGVSILKKVACALEKRNEAVG